MIILFIMNICQVLVAIIKVIYHKNALISLILQLSYCGDCLSATADIMDLWNVNNTIWDQHTVLASGASPAGGTDAFCFSIHSNTLTTVPTATITNHWQTQTHTSTWVKSCVTYLWPCLLIYFSVQLVNNY